ncbi:MAG: hypothetical protein PWQ10_242 [Patescibacteria group bacterium]|nr:hypothetical protein [Patescibacteria group bacterium]
MIDRVGDYQPIGDRYSFNNIYRVDGGLSNETDKYELGFKRPIVLNLGEKAIKLINGENITPVMVDIIIKIDDGVVVKRIDSDFIEIPKEPLLISVEVEQIGLKSEIIKNIYSQLLNLSMISKEIEKASIDYKILKDSKCSYMDRVMVISQVNPHGHIELGDNMLLNEEMYAELSQNRKVDNLDSKILEAVFCNNHNLSNRSPRRIYGEGAA